MKKIKKRRIKNVDDKLQNYSSQMKNFPLKYLSVLQCV